MSTAAPRVLGPVRPLLDGLRFAESPRWHDGALWFSDIFARRVLRMTQDGQAETVVQFSGDELPAGLGFLPDGRLLIVDMHHNVLLRLDGPSAVQVHADLSALTVGDLNDMVVDREGRAYVGAMGTHGAGVPRPVPANGRVILVEPDGSARVVADKLDAPNGPVISADGHTYVVAEFPAQTLVSFERTPSGSLINRRVWADLRPGSADGIGIDVQNGIWTASPLQSVCRRVVDGGAVTDVVPLPDGELPLACCLGGHDGHTLFILTAIGGIDRVQARTNTSVIYSAEVEIPGF